MTTLRIALALTAFVCASAQAQECSGGAGGGCDATGNQCSTPATSIDASYVPTNVVRPIAVITAPTLVRPVVVGRASRAGAPGVQLASAHPPAGHSPVAAKAAGDPVHTHTAKLGDTSDSSCSGGIDGGIDATGNQCNSADEAANVVVARVHAR